MNHLHFCSSCGAPVSHDALLCKACLPLIYPTIEKPWQMKPVGSIASQHGNLIWIDEIDYEDAKTPIEAIKTDLAEMHGVCPSSVFLDKITQEGNAMVGHFAVRKTEPKSGET